MQQIWEQLFFFCDSIERSDTPPIVRLLYLNMYFPVFKLIK
jgi:hypothetical protein